jgi:hypothetical protein
VASGSAGLSGCAVLRHSYVCCHGADRARATPARATATVLSWYTHLVWHVPRGPGRRDCAPHPRPAAATCAGPAGNIGQQQPQLLRRRRDRRRMHRAGYVRSPCWHGLVTAGWCRPRQFVLVTVRLGYFDAGWSRYPSQHMKCCHPGAPAYGAACGPGQPC